MPNADSPAPGLIGVKSASKNTQWCPYGVPIGAIKTFWGTTKPPALAGTGGELAGLATATVCLPVGIFVHLQHLGQRSGLGPLSAAVLLLRQCEDTST